MKSAIRLLAAVGGVALLVLLATLAAPKTARGVVAALVQIVGNVSVVNPLDSGGSPTPLLTHDTNSRGQEPFDILAECLFYGGAGNNQCFQTNFLLVPTGKIAKVESASITCNFNGTAPTLAYIGT
ncbi:unnamed protein product, partial [marine sediment metagenome]